MKIVITIGCACFFSLTSMAQSRLSNHSTDSISVKTKASSQYDTCKSELPYGLSFDYTTSSVVCVSDSVFHQGNISDPLQLISGMVAGLDISKAGGDPITRADVRLRGLNTLYSNPEPLIVIDGFPGASLENIDPNDIASITVLKDGSSAAMYGFNGSSGVILIQTRRGTPGKPFITYKTSLSVEKIARNQPVLNTSEWKKLSEEVNMGQDFGYQTDWYSAIAQTALAQIHHLSLSGGNEHSSYQASMNYRQGEGTLQKTGFNQFNGRIRFSQHALKNKLLLDVSLSSTMRKASLGFGDAFRYAATYNPTAPVTSEDPAYQAYDGYFQQVIFDSYNPVALLNLDKNERKTGLLSARIQGILDLSKVVKIRTIYATESYNSLWGQYYDKNDFWKGTHRNGLANRKSDDALNRMFETSFILAFPISSGFSFTLNSGYQNRKQSNTGFLTEGGNFTTDAFHFNSLGAAKDFNDGFGTVSSYANTSVIQALFAKTTMQVNEWFYFNAGLRYEGSSQLGTDQKWGLFPFAGVALNFAEMLRLTWFSDFRIRGSYGITGNLPVNSGPELLHTDPSGNYYNENYFIGVNPTLSFEKQRNFNAGFDIALSSSHAMVSVDYYHRTAVDLLFPFQSPVPPATTSWLNLGKLTGSGLEIALNYPVVHTSRFCYNVSIAASRNFSNALHELRTTINGTTVDLGTRDLGSMGSPGQNAVPTHRIEADKPVGQLLTLVYKGIDSNGNLLLSDENKDGFINILDRTVTGNGLPKTLIGFGNDIALGKWGMSAFLRGVFGHRMINSSRAFYEMPYLVAYYNVPEGTTSVRNHQTGTLLNGTTGVLTDQFVENASFLSLENLNVHYVISLSDNSGIKSIRFDLTGNNLFYLTSYKGSDPNPRYGDIENNNNPVLPGIDRRGTWFRTRSFTLGLSMIF